MFCSSGDPCKVVFEILLVNLVVQLLRTLCSYWSKDVINFDDTVPLKVAVV